jgi:hypothetical protein
MNQFFLSHAVVTTLPISRTEPIITMGQKAAAKIAVNPMIEYHAATPDSVSATNKAI